jgi:hypothetical protein
MTDEISRLARLDESVHGLSDLLYQLWELRERLTLAEQKWDDPNALRRRIAELEADQAS